MLLEFYDASLSNIIFCYFCNLFGFECLTAIYFLEALAYLFYWFYLETPDILFPIYWIYLFYEFDIGILDPDLFIVFRYDPRLENIP